MTTKPYPQRNPFPHQGSAKVKGLNLDKPVSIPRTIPLLPIKEFCRAGKNYIKNYSGAANQEGRAIAFRGDYGSGKTHALWYMIAYVTNLRRQPTAASDTSSDTLKRHVLPCSNFEIPEGIERPVQLYAKADSPDFMEVFRDLMAHVSLELLRKMIGRFVEVVADEEIKRQVQETPSGQRAKLEELFSEYLFTDRANLVEAGTVYSRQSEEIGQVQRQSEFQNAFYYLITGGDERKIAYQWLTGIDVPPNECEMIGVKGPIETVQDAKIVLLLLAKLFKRVGQPFIIYIDQYENLLLRANQQPISEAAFKENIGALTNIAELSSQEHEGMVVFSGPDDAWQVLPEYLQSRFGANVISFPAVRPEDAEELIHLYLTPSDKPFARNGADKDLYPFTHKAVEELLRYRGGNIRSLLQNCATVFDEALPEKLDIEDELVKKALRERSDYQAIDRETLFHRMENTFAAPLAEQALRFERDVAIGPLTIDLAAVAPDHTPRLIVKVSEALFYDGEADDALDFLNEVAEAVKTYDVPVRSVLVTLGYVSPEIQKTVQGQRLDHIVYDKPERFMKRFGEIIAMLPAGKPVEGSSDIELEVLKEELAAVRDTLQNIAQTRTQEAGITEERLVQLLGQQAQDRSAERWDNVRQAWLDERRRLHDKIKDARRERETRDLDELETLRARANRIQERRPVYWMILFLVIGVSAFLFQWTTSQNSIAALDASLHRINQDIQQTDSLLRALSIAARIMADEFVTDADIGFFVNYDFAFNDSIAVTRFIYVPDSTQSFLYQLQADFSPGLGRIIQSTASFEEKLIAVSDVSLTSNRLRVSILDAHQRAETTRSDLIARIDTLRFFVGLPITIFVIALLLLLWLRASNRLGWADELTLASAVGSMKELERAARRYASPPSTDTSRLLRFYGTPGLRVLDMMIGRSRALPRHPNPHFRYAAFLHGNKTGRSTFDDLLEALPREDSAIVRRAFVQSLAAHDLQDEDTPKKSNDGDQNRLDDEALHKLAEDVPETVYLIEAYGKKKRLKDPSFLEKKGPLQRPFFALVAFYKEYNIDQSNLAAQLASGKKTDNKELHALEEAYLNSIRPNMARELSKIPRADIQQAADDLSPFNEGGLGTYDELDKIAEIDRLYLFFRQFLYFKERDLLTASGPPRG